MLRKLVHGLPIALVVVLFVACLAFAAGQEATVSSVDTEKGSIQLITADGKLHEVALPKDKQAELQPGDNVMVEVDADGSVQGVTKKP